MDRGIVTAELLNIRSYPGSRGKVITQLDRNTVVNITKKKFDWFQIRHNNRPAYAFAKYIKSLENEINLRARVIASRLNVRSGPSTSNPVIGQVFADDTLDVIGDEDSWYEIQFNQRKGFIHRDYVQVVEGGHRQKGFVSAALLNVRKAANGKSQIIGKLVSGNEVDILSETKYWYEIKFNQSSAYVSKRFISKAIGQQESKYFYKKERLKQLALAPGAAALFTGGQTKEQRRVVKTWNAYGNLLEQIADGMDIDVGCAIAVLCVESGGEGFDKNGRCIIRFENHHMWKRWGKHQPEEFEKHFQFNDDQKWKGHKFRINENDDWQRFHGNQDKEWQVLDMACAYDEEAAYQSISLGLPQIMGFNYKKIGYQSVQRMFNNLTTDVRYQLFAMFDFFDNRMISALKSYDFERFARYYNGPGQASDYGGWIQDHYDAFHSFRDS